MGTIQWIIWLKLGRSSARTGKSSCESSVAMARVFAPSDAKGGCTIETSKTALVCIEYQNEFTTEGGKLNPGVKGVMEETGMLDNTVKVADAMRSKGAKV